jgi:type II secretory pathway pseudopilin PulG
MREDGMTIVEVVVAGLILVLGAIGVLGVVDAATRNTFRAEQSQVVANVLQSEMEELRQLPYEKLTLTSLPAHSSDAANPNSRVASATFFYTGRSGTGLKPLVYNGSSNKGDPVEGGTVDPGPTPFTVGDVKGEIYRYVVWDTCPSALCAERQLLKRAVVAVKLDTTASGGTRRYQEVQGQFVDPDAEPATFPSQEPGGDDDLAWNLWLTDTPCDQSERLGHPQSEGNHATHNTRGDCADGVQTGNVPGAPDLLWTAAPTELTPQEKEEGVPLDFMYDYANDVEPQPAEDQGLQLLSGGDCSSAGLTDLARGVATEPDPAATATNFQKVHRWLSPPVPANEGEEPVLLTGDGTLTLWTRTIGGAVYQGRICAWLFVRSYGDGTITDTLAVNLGPPQSLYFDYFATAWPSSGWTRITIPLGFGYAEEGGALPLPPGARLGLSLSVGSDTPSGLQIVYDERSFEGTLMLKTTGAVPPGVITPEP